MFYIIHLNTGRNPISLDLNGLFLNWFLSSSFYFVILSFHPDEKAKRHPSVHIPFGLGPRNCIGMRFALMEAKMALLTILRKFKFERSPDTEVNIFLDCICLELMITLTKWQLKLSLIVY